MKKLNFPNIRDWSLALLGFIVTMAALLSLLVDTILNIPPHWSISFMLAGVVLFFVSLMEYQKRKIRKLEKGGEK